MVGMVVGRRSGLGGTVASCLAAAVALLAAMPDARAVQGCPDLSSVTIDKVLFGSVGDLGGGGGARFGRDLPRAVEMKFDRAEATLSSKAKVVYCPDRNVMASNSYNEDVVKILNDEKVLLEVGAKVDGPDIVVTYVIIPVRYYALSATPPETVQGYLQVLYDPSRISAGPLQLFKGNAELRLMMALGLAIRQEKLAKSEQDKERRRSLSHSARGFYCDAMGALKEAAPLDDSPLGLLPDEWAALAAFTKKRIDLLFEDATAALGDATTMTVIESERQTASDSDAATPDNEVEAGIARCVGS